MRSEASGEESGRNNLLYIIITYYFCIFVHPGARGPRKRAGGRIRQAERAESHSVEV